MHRPLRITLRLLRAALVFSLCFSVHPLAQSAAERLLIPLQLEPRTPGAKGSLWTTTLAARNNGQVPVEIAFHAQDCGGISLCPPGGPLMPQRAAELQVLHLPGWPGTFLRVDSAHVYDVAFTLRVHDESRALETWGTSVPVVREKEFTTGTVALIDLPTDQRFRTHLRVYDLDGGGGAVRVRVYGTAMMKYPSAPDVPVGDRLVTLQLVPGEWRGLLPGYAEVTEVAAVARDAGFSRAIVEVTPDPAIPIWAFVSVTNNDTQHVTVITPSPCRQP